MDALEAAGLTSNEAKIYKLLLRMSSANTTDLAKKSGVHRRSVYDVLMRLSDKGLVSYMVVEGVKKYFPANPSELSKLLEDRQKVVEEDMPELVKMFESNSKKKSTQFFFGKKGVKQVLEDQIRIGEDVLILGGSNSASELLRYYMPKYTNLRIEKNIKLKIIYSGDSVASKVPLSESKSMPKGVGGDVAINIYGDHVALIMWKLDQPFAIHINDSDVSKSFRDYFNFMWKKLK